MSASVANSIAQTAAVVLPSGFVLARSLNVMVRISKQPNGHLDGTSLAHFRVGQVYEVPPSHAEYLVMEGFAVVEMRRNGALVARGLSVGRTELKGPDQVVFVDYTLGCQGNNLQIRLFNLGKSVLRWGHERPGSYAATEKASPRNRDLHRPDRADDGGRRLCAAPLGDFRRIDRAHAKTATTH